MTVWLSPDDVADRLGVCRRTAMTLMYQMSYSVIGGTSKKRIRVSEDALDEWMLKRTEGTRQPVSRTIGSRKRLERR